MMLFVMMLGMSPIVTADRVEATLITTDGDVTLEQVPWKRPPGDAELARWLPAGKPGAGYAHLRCARIRPDGRLAGCRTAQDASGYGTPFDPDFEKAGLATIGLFRVDPAFAERWRKRRYAVTVGIAFVRGGAARVWGNCYPFCQAGLPAAPRAPVR